MFIGDRPITWNGGSVKVHIIGDEEDHVKCERPCSINNIIIILCRCVDPHLLVFMLNFPNVYKQNIFPDISRLQAISL